jgi:hypothetical protein
MTMPFGERPTGVGAATVGLGLGVALGCGTPGDAVGATLVVAEGDAVGATSVVVEGGGVSGIVDVGVVVAVWPSGSEVAVGFAPPQPAIARPTTSNHTHIQGRMCLILWSSPFRKLEIVATFYLGRNRPGSP